MTKRKMVLGTYDTAAQGWTLNKWQLSAATQKTNIVPKPSGDGSWDLSTALTDGIPMYGDRTLTATFERSDGDRLTRKEQIARMINSLDGMRVQIVLPDDPLRYLMGRIHVAKDYNDLAHAAVTVTATCEPWLYATQETAVSLTAATTAKTTTLTNSGRRAVVPIIQVTGTNASVLLQYGGKSAALSAGKHQWADLLLTPGDHTLTYSGTGSVTLTYREGVLE